MRPDAHYLKKELYDLIKKDSSIFEFLQSGSLDGIWYWDLEDTENEWMSPRFWSSMGYDPYEKKHLASEWQDLIHPDDLQVTLDNFRKHCADPHHPYDQVVRYRHKDGSTVWVRCRGIAIRDSAGKPIRLLGAHTDLTPQKKAEADLQKALEEIKESNVRFAERAKLHQVLLDALPCVALLLKPSTREIVASNEAGRNSGAYIGETCYGTWGQRDDPCPWCLAPKVWLTGEPQHLEVGAVGVIWDAYWYPISDDLYLHYAFDITEKKAREKGIQLSQKMESIGNLAGGVAHDFNNILSSIIGFTELALDEAPEDSPLADSLQEVYSAGKRAKDLVKQILAFARQSNEKRSPIQPSMVAKEVLKFIRSTIPTTIEIRQEIDSESWIFGNTTQVHQVLMNLCTNAAHAMEESGGILEVRMKDLFLNKENSQIGMRQGNYIEIKVSDSGAGIAPEIIEAIFEPYFTTKDPGEGSGMGLAMVKGIIEGYGGKITIDSQLGKGTTFTVFLPVTKKLSGPIAYVPEQLPIGTERILFVDDEAPIVKMGSQILESLGYSVTTRTSSVEALELFKAKPNDFELVVTDMTMPNLTGDKLAVELMKIRPDIPVILSTGYSKKISDESAEGIGIKALAYKPMVKADLAKTVRKVLDEAKS